MRGRARTRACSPAAAPFALTIVPAIVGRDRRSCVAVALALRARATSSGGWRPVGAGLGRVAPLAAPPRGDRARVDVGRRALRAATSCAPRLGRCSGRSAWWGLRHRACCGPRSARSGGAPAVRGARAGVLRRDARQPAAAPGRDRRRGRRHDRRVRGVRRRAASLALLAVLVYRLFAFWLPTIPGAIAYFQLRRTVSRWRASDTE